MMKLQNKLSNYAMVVAIALLVQGCAGVLDKVSAKLEDTSIKGQIISSVQPGAENAPKRFVIIDGFYGDTLEEEHLLQKSENPLTQATYREFNLDKAYVQQILTDAGWEEVSPEQFVADKSNVTIVTMYATWWLHKKAPKLPPILTPTEKAKIIAKEIAKAVAKDAAKGFGKKLLGDKLKSGDDDGEKEEKPPLQEGDPVDAYYYLVVGAFETTDGNDDAKRPTEIYWQTTSFFKTEVAYGEQDDRANYERFMPVLASLIKPHLGQTTGGKVKLAWPNEELAQFKNNARFYERYGCERQGFLPGLKTLKANKADALTTAQETLQSLTSNESENRFLASLGAQQRANTQQDIWDNEHGIRTLTELIEQQC
ncbi:MAG: hypothetical protein K0U39_08245 [Alphaproteobacteria bacterium]|nr:hypothetical protein [Alphaproteobacteria bacterium]